MRVKVSYPITRYAEIEIPDELANKFENAQAKDDYDEIEYAWDGIDEYIRDTVPQIDTDVDDVLDWLDWEVVD